MCERKKFYRMCGIREMKSFSMMFKFSCLYEASEIHNEIMMCYCVKFFCDVIRTNIVIIVGLCKIEKLVLQNCMFLEMKIISFGAMHMDYFYMLLIEILCIEKFCYGIKLSWKA